MIQQKNLKTTTKPPKTVSIVYLQRIRMYIISMNEHSLLSLYQGITEFTDKDDHIMTILQNTFLFTINVRILWTRQVNEIVLFFLLLFVLTSRSLFLLCVPSKTGITRVFFDISSFPHLVSEHVICFRFHSLLLWLSSNSYVLFPFGSFGSRAYIINITVV